MSKQSASAAHCSTKNTLNRFGEFSLMKAEVCSDKGRSTAADNTEAAVNNTSVTQRRHRRDTVTAAGHNR